MAECVVELHLAADRDRRAERAAARSFCSSITRLCPLCRPQDLGRGAAPARPERGRAMGPAAVLRRPPEVRPQGADHPGRREQGRVSSRADRDRRAGARRLGGDSGRCRLDDRRHQRRHSLYLRRSPRSCVYGIIMARLGVELEIPVSGRVALGRADGVLRGLDWFRDHHRAAVRRLAQSDRDRRGAERRDSACSTGTGCRCSRCS